MLVAHTLQKLSEKGSLENSFVGDLAVWNVVCPSPVLIGHLAESRILGERCLPSQCWKPCPMVVLVAAWLLRSLRPSLVPAFQLWPVLFSESFQILSSSIRTWMAFACMEMRVLQFQAFLQSLPLLSKSSTFGFLPHTFLNSCQASIPPHPLISSHLFSSFPFLFQFWGISSLPATLLMF